jgi:hypothetical protein
MSEFAHVRYQAVPRRLPAMTRPAQMLLGLLLISGPSPLPYYLLEKRMHEHTGVAVGDVRAVVLCALEELLGLALVEEVGEVPTGPRPAARAAT